MDWQLLRMQLRPGVEARFWELAAFGCFSSKRIALLCRSSPTDKWPNVQIPFPKGASIVQGCDHFGLLANVLHTSTVLWPADACSSQAVLSVGSLWDNVVAMPIVGPPWTLPDRRGCLATQMTDPLEHTRWTIATLTTQETRFLHFIFSSTSVPLCSVMS